MLGGALPFVAVWIVGTTVGVVAGPIIPDSWQIGFIVPLMFLAVMVPTLRRSEDVVALCATGVVVLLSRAYRSDSTCWSASSRASRSARCGRRLPMPDARGAAAPDTVADAAEHEAEGGL